MSWFFPTRATTNQNVLAGKNVVFESIGELLVECSGSDQVLSFQSGAR